jgi:hypothetical protein
VFNLLEESNSDDVVHIDDTVQNSDLPLKAVDDNYLKELFDV